MKLNHSKLTLTKLRFLTLVFLTVLFVSLTSFTNYVSDPGSIPDWSQLDPELDGYEGTRTLRLYEFLSAVENLPEQQEVIVAVIDSGFDTEHPALKENIWRNEAEINGVDGIDDDGNGYIDDYHGWNFLGDVKYLNLEVTRELKRLKKSNTPLDDPYFLKVLEYYTQEQEDISNTLETLEAIGITVDKAFQTLKEGGYPTDYKVLKESIEDTKGKYKAAAVTLLTIESLFGINPDEISRIVEEYRIKSRVLFDTTDTHILIGDDPFNLEERGYGSNVLLLDDKESHGTHVAGTIAANVRGIGQAPFAKIMCLRAVPNEGDERDKDIGNAIRYAVDNGAKIINMSAGKYFSVHPDYVSDAINYANENGVLFVVSAGNEGFNLEENPNFPRKFFVENGEIKTIPNMIVVGASSWMKKWEKELDPGNYNLGFDLAAPFSNYSGKVVDVFAPGVEINSTVPDGKFERLSGTSMASPQVSGIAAIIRSYFPQLSPHEVKQLINNSARQYNGLKVRLRNSNEVAEFGTLSVSGGVIDVMNAFEFMLAGGS